MRYPVTLTRDGEGFSVSFPDVPEALTYGATEAEAMDMARDALETAMEFYLEDGREAPSPSEIRQGERFIELPDSFIARCGITSA
jgi:antitoxin HicB